MSKTFAVTGTGRCGTKSIATMLNTASGWTVEHEPVNDRCQMVTELQTRFARRSSEVGNYGEVNSWLRFGIVPLDVDRKAIVVRDPMDVYKSIVRKKIGRVHGSTKRELAASRQIQNLNHSLLALDAAIVSGIPMWLLEEVNADPQRFARFVCGCEVPADAVPRLNAAENPDVPIPKVLLEKADKTFGWFRREYL